MANDLKTMFHETSAKVGINVKQLFKDLASTLPGVEANATGKGTAPDG